MLAPPGGSPAALTNLPGTGGALGQASSVVGYSLGVLPGQAALFTTEPLESSLSLVGSGRIDLEVTSSTPNATLFASLWDLGPDVERTVGRPDHHRAELGGAAAARRGPHPAHRAHPGSAHPGHGGAAGGRPPGPGGPPAPGGDLQHRPGVRAAHDRRGLPDRAQRRPGAGPAPGRADRAGRRPVRRAAAVDHRGLPAGGRGGGGRRAVPAAAARGPPEPRTWSTCRLVVDGRGQDLQGRLPGGRRHLVPRRARAGRGAARAQRGRQDHRDPDAGRADPARLRARST